jgi:hypothetical protein
MEGQLCPVCNLENPQIDHVPGYDAYKVCCKRCGTFMIEGNLLIKNRSHFSEDDKPLLPYLSAYIRQSTQRGATAEISRNTWQNLARAHSTTSVSRKVAKLLELIGSRSSYPGEKVQVNENLDYPLVNAHNGEEVTYFLNHLIDRNLVKDTGLLGMSRSVYLTTQGWDLLEPSGGGSGIPGRCFVAMSFDPSLNDAYELGIRLAIEDNCKLQAVRIDYQHHNEKICDKILAEIRLSQFVVADFTFHRGGVYFEAGFALGLGRPVIWTCRESDLKDTHFDTRQYNHILWSDPADLRSKLTDRIRATILG